MLNFLKKGFEDEFKDYFANIDDIKCVRIHDAKIDNSEIYYLLIYHDQLCKYESNDSKLNPILINSLSNKKYHLNDTELEGVTEIDSKDYEKIERYLFSGNLLVYSPFTNKLFSVPYKNNELLNDDNEKLRTNVFNNIGLIRRTIKSAKLKNLSYTLGEVSKTNVNILYLEDVANPEVIQEVKENINKCTIDAVESLAQLHNIALGCKSSVLPLLNQVYDVESCKQALLNGQFLILSDNNFIGLTGPVNITDFISTSKREHYLVSVLEKILKNICLIVGLLTMGVIATLYNFNPELMPYIFINDVINARKGIFVNIGIELILAEFLFQMLRLITVKHSTTLKSAFALIGAFIIVQLAMTSGLIGPDILILSGISFISLYVVSNNHGFSTIMYLLRINIFYSSLTFGLIGFSFSTIFTCIFLLTKQSFEVPFLYPLSPFNPKKLLHDLITNLIYGSNSKLTNKYKEGE
jgi:hypothetical protein